MVSLFSVEGLSGLLFFCFIGLTLAGAVIATSARSLIRSVAGLALCFLGVAGLYYYLNSPFVALMQILIYVGAVCVTIIFAVMLAGSSELKQLTQRNGLVGRIVRAQTAHPAQRAGRPPGHPGQRHFGLCLGRAGLENGMACRSLPG